MDNSPERLDRIKAKLASIPEGRELLDLALRQNCDIAFADFSTGVRSSFKQASGRIELQTPLMIDTDAFKLCFADGAKPTFNIFISAECADEELPALLGHELRHLWQREILAQEKMLNLSVPFDMGLCRVMEGDAYAFQDYIQARLNDPAIKSPADFNWQAAFIKYQESGTSLHYDRAQIERSGRRFQLIEGMLNNKIIDRKTAFQYAAGIFNRHSLADLADLPKITKAGLGKDAPNYLGSLSPNAMLSKAIWYMDRHDLEVARSSMRSVHPDLGKHYKAPKR